MLAVELRCCDDGDTVALLGEEDLLTAVDPFDRFYLLGQGKDVVVVGTLFGKLDVDVGRYVKTVSKQVVAIFAAEQEILF